MTSVDIFAIYLGMWDRILAKIKMSNDKTLQGNLIKNEIKSYITELPPLLTSETSKIEIKVSVRLITP
jgi:hypothetical protein